MTLIPTRFVCHSYRVAILGLKHGWLPGARYTNLRDVRRFDRLGFLDIVWQDYDFRRHMEAVKSTCPVCTVAKDLEDISELDRIIDEAYELLQYADTVVVVPKAPAIANCLDEIIPRDFVLGFSVPTAYGKTVIQPHHFMRPVHLLGGRPDVQRLLARTMPVVSLDCNRFTLDAAYGDYFDGQTFRPHPLGGYERCIQDSLLNINRLWLGYSVS